MWVSAYPFRKMPLLAPFQGIHPPPPTVPRAMSWPSQALNEQGLSLRGWHDHLVSTQGWPGLHGGSCIRRSQSLRVETWGGALPPLPPLPCSRLESLAALGPWGGCTGNRESLQDRTPISQSRSHPLHSSLTSVRPDPATYSCSLPAPRPGSVGFWGRGDLEGGQTH